jgi:hypothetical protein
VEPWTIGPPGATQAERRSNLVAQGPIIDLIIRREDGAQAIEAVPNFFESRAMIDTGASDVCIDYRIAHALNLRQIDSQTIGTVGGPVHAAVYLAIVHVPVLHYREPMRVYAPKLDRAGYGVLLGRTFLSEFLMTYDGEDGVCHFARKHASSLPVNDE